MIFELNSNDLACAYVPDVVYVSRDGVDLKLQLLIPYKFQDTDSKYPLIVFVQGSGWGKQNCYGNIPVLSKFALRGYVVAVVEYRGTEIATFPAQVQDAKTAIRFLRKNADQYPIDTEHVYLWGDSSGAHTALLAGMTATDSIFDTSDYAEYPCTVDAIIDYYGVTDVCKTDEFPLTPDPTVLDSPAALLIGGKNILDYPALTEPTICQNYISTDKSIPSIFIIHGTNDQLVMHNQSLSLHDKLVECHKNTELHLINGADHGGPAFWTDEVLDLVEDFIKATR